MNFLTIFIAVLVISICESESLTFNCLFGYHPYSCKLKKSTQVTSKHDREIFEVRGQHRKGKSNDDVTQFFSYEDEINFLPRGLTKFFKNIEKIFFRHASLQEIKKYDLKEFSDKLKVLDLAYNEIRVIEKIFFKFNRNLMQIDLSFNKIFHIDSGAFRGLEKLQKLDLTSNPCTITKDFVLNDTQAVLKLITKVEKFCNSSEALNYWDIELNLG